MSSCIRLAIRITKRVRKDLMRKVTMRNLRSLNTTKLDIHTFSIANMHKQHIMTMILTMSSNCINGMHKHDHHILLLSKHQELFNKLLQARNSNQQLHTHGILSRHQKMFTRNLKKNQNTCTECRMLKLLLSYKG
jgi:hypothetical protein